MAILLYIDTAGEKAMVGLSNDAQLLALEENTQSNTHASFVQVSIEKILNTAAIKIQAIDAVVVTMGPGSYTGLRVGLASAKGIAYALNKPLIGISTLALLAHQAVKSQICIDHAIDMQIFSMIDAKRMEVFGALYNTNLEVIIPEQAIILDEIYIENILAKGPLVCIGNGVTKTKTLVKHSNLFFIDENYTIDNFIQLALLKLNNKQFENIAYSSPSYLKDFYQKPS